MGNSQASLAATLPENLGLARLAFEQAVEQPRDFHFAVTWVTLFAHLDLIEARGPRPHAQPAPTRALVPVVASAPLCEIPAPRDPLPASEAAAWEMVVPKMIRTGTGTFAPMEPGEAAS